MSNIEEMCAESYSRLKHLKLVGEEVGLPWQTVYVNLKKLGIAVTGDKARYGSITDKFAAKAESMFQESVPFAINNNESEFQSTVDFDIGNIKIDIKASSLTPAYLDPSGKKMAARWGFCVNKQRDIADIFVLYAFDSNAESLLHIFMIPGDIARGKTTISIPLSLKSKWADYEVKETDLQPFFSALSENMHI